MAEEGDPTMQTTAPDLHPVDADDRPVDVRSRSALANVRTIGSTDPFLRWGTTAFLVVIGIVHFHLWEDGYRTLPTIGPLFLVAVASAGLLALFTSVQLNWVTATAAAFFAAGTLAANLASLLLPQGLFGFNEIGVSYSGAIAIASEVGVVVLTGMWAHRRLRSGRSRPGRRFGNGHRTSRCCAHR